MAHIRVVICKKLGFHFREICKKLGFLLRNSLIVRRLSSANRCSHRLDVEGCCRFALAEKPFWLFPRRVLCRPNCTF